MRFSPQAGAPSGVRSGIFAGDDVLRAPFDRRLHPPQSGRSPRPAVAGRADRRSRWISAASRAARTTVFEEEVGKSFGLELSDLSRETWSLVPPFGDLLIEIRTGRFGTLTYARAGDESEDITLFDRQRRRNISVYASAAQAGARAAASTTKTTKPTTTCCTTTIEPLRAGARCGSTVARCCELTVRSYALGTLTLRLAESLVVQSITSPALRPSAVAARAGPEQRARQPADAARARRRRWSSPSPTSGRLRSRHARA